LGLVSAQTEPRIQNSKFRIQNFSTLPREPGERLVFEYVSVVKQADRFDWVPVGEFEVDLDANELTERWFDRSISPRAAHATSPVHEGTVPGSYRPMAS